MQPNAELMDVVRLELRAPLSTALEQAGRINVVVVAESIPVPSADRSAMVATTVVPLELAGIAQHFLILFGPAREDENPPTVPVAPSKETENGSPLPLD